MGLSAPVPEPVTDADGDVAMFSVEIAAALRHGQRLEGCCVCQTSSGWVWPVADVAAAIRFDPDDPREVPASWSALPAEVGLHPNCVPGLMNEQAWIRWGDDLPQQRTRPVAAVTSAPTGSARKAGAYGRRRS